MSSLLNSQDPELNSDEEEEEEAERQEPTSSCMRELGWFQIYRVIEGMQHTTNCFVPGENCKFDLCYKMSCVLQHTRNCEKRRRRECAVCNQVIAITVFHGIECTLERCKVPFCENVRNAASDYRPGSRCLVELDHLTNKVIQELRDLPGEEEEREQMELEMADEEPEEGLFATDACADLVP